MKPVTHGLVVALLLMTTVGCAPRLEPKAPELSDQLLVQVDRVFASITAAQQEYEHLFGDTKYPNEDEKNDATKWFAQKETVFHIVRILHLDLKEKRTRESLTAFISAAWTFVDSPEGTFTRYDYADKSLTNGREVYANMSKIENIVAEFRVFAVSVLKEVK